MTVEHELKTIQSEVDYLLEKYPDARNNDLYLMVLYWRLIDKADIPFIPFSTIKVCSPPSSIWRVRQRIQNTLKRFPPTDPEVAKKRAERAKKFRDIFSSQ